MFVMLVMAWAFKPCPLDIAQASPVPLGWKLYPGDSRVFHCGFYGIMEDIPDAPKNECFYDAEGVLVDDTHAYSGCVGTANMFDQSESVWSLMAHVFIDPGGVLRAGGPAFFESLRYHWNSASSKQEL